MRHNQHIQLLHLIFGLRHMRHTDLNLCYLLSVQKKHAGSMTVKNTDFRLELFLVFHQQHSQHMRHLLSFESNHNLETKPTPKDIFLNFFCEKYTLSTAQRFTGRSQSVLEPSYPALYARGS